MCNIEIYNLFLYVLFLIIHILIVLSNELDINVLSSIFIRSVIIASCEIQIMLYFFILISYKKNNDSIIINLKNRIAPTVYLVLLYKLKIICIVCQLPQEVSDYKEDSLSYFYRYILLLFRFKLLFR